MRIVYNEMRFTVKVMRQVVFQRTLIALIVSKCVRMSFLLRGQIKYLSSHSVPLGLLASHPVWTASSKTERTGRSSSTSGFRCGFWRRFQPDLHQTILYFPLVFIFRKWWEIYLLNADKASFVSLVNSCPWSEWIWSSQSVRKRQSCPSNRRKTYNRANSIWTQNLIPCPLRSCT